MSAEIHMTSSEGLNFQWLSVTFADLISKYAG